MDVHAWGDTGRSCTECCCCCYCCCHCCCCGLSYPSYPRLDTLHGVGKYCFHKGFSLLSGLLLLMQQLSHLQLVLVLVLLPLLLLHLHLLL